MPRTEWYVVRVLAGRDLPLCAAVSGACAERDARVGAKRPTLERCFSPRYATQRKEKGEWRTVHRSLMPGYLIAETADPGALAEALRDLPEYARLLSVGERYVPLSTEERTWLDDSTQHGERPVPMSMAYKEGDRLVVTTGPLKGREASVVRTARSKNVAHLEINVGGIRIRTTVGLGVLPKDKALAHRKG